jgi:hypothetical protein
MATANAAASGEFMIGGDLRVTRLGFGAMRITGKGIWDQPSDPAEARRTLAALPDLGIDLIDTADSYGPFVSEDLIAEVLSPYKGMTIATKGGLTRHGPDIWKPLGRPEYLRQCVLMSLRRLKLERIDLWQLHRIDPKVPAEEQFGEIAAMRKEGLIRHVGLSEVRRRDRGGSQALPGDDGAEPLQPRRPQKRGGAGLLREEWHWFHPLGAAVGRIAGAAGLRADRDRGQAGHGTEPGGAGLGAEAVTGDDPHSRHRQCRPPAGERRGCHDHADRSRVRSFGRAGAGGVARPTALRGVFWFFFAKKNKHFFL